MLWRSPPKTRKNPKVRPRKIRRSLLLGERIDGGRAAAAKGRLVGRHLLGLVLFALRFLFFLGLALLSFGHDEVSCFWCCVAAGCDLSRVNLSQHGSFFHMRRSANSLLLSLPRLRGRADASEASVREGAASNALSRFASLSLRLATLSRKRARGR